MICTAIAFLMLLFSPWPSAAKEIGPRTEFCAEANALKPGEELVLGPGKYQGPCTIHHGGRPGAPVVIRAADALERPWIVFDGNFDNVINIRADYVIIRGLKIGPTARDVDGIRIYAQHGITVEDCQFSELGGIAVVANHHSAIGITVRRNIVTNTFATVMYFGCHDGSVCNISDLLVENNFISGVSAPDPEIGYGIEVKLNSAGILRDNIIVNTKGPGIMVYGARDPNLASIVNGNFTSGSRTSAGIVVGGGPAVVLNNISIQNRDAGISIEDYGNRDLLRKITVEYNTVYNNYGGGIILHAQKEVDAVIFNNAIASPVGASILPRRQSGLKMFANQDCSAIRCFKSPEERDLTPIAGSPLVGAAQGESLDPLRERDYFGTKRPPHAAIGAVEPPGGVVRMGVKR